MLIAFALYCRRRSTSYIGTGRVAEIDAWYNKATVTWLFTICLSLALIIKLI
ncbi:hypothetical protein [Mucilaginibacter terrigena]|uniref:hypothetical protein n=1 Tax=Mucilaginibacter terrigena TaxID=2492395 RepID=UPI0013968248|nr:hypothetical protein [Mucilaginibacter terrigena]